MKAANYATETQDKIKTTISPDAAQAYITDMLGELGVIAKQAGLSDTATLLRLVLKSLKG